MPSYTDCQESGTTAKILTVPAPSLSGKWHACTLLMFTLPFGPLLAILLPVFPISSQLESYMDLTAARQKLVATNIANASTPGYKTKDIDFHAEFISILDGTAAGASSSPRVSDVAGLASGNDGNNVSLERESRLLSENALRFNAASQLWRSGMKQLKMAIEGGRNG